MKSASVVTRLAFFSLFIGSQIMAQQHQLLAEDGETQDHFGYSVAIDGSTALVGAFKADVNSNQDAGAAYVYILGVEGWQQQAKLIAEPAFAEDTLGGNVALKNNFALLGVIGHDKKAENAGAVLAFERITGSWSQTQWLMAADGKAGDAFGQSIALTEAFLVIGAPRSDAPDKDTGSAYVYTRENNVWQFQTRLTANDGAAGDLFGISVAIDGDTILVGADLNDEKADNAGAVYFYVYEGEKWRQQAKLTADDGADTDIFGVRVALSGDTALISARRDDIDGVGEDAGSAYIFERTEHQWVQTQKLVAPDGKADDRFARGVALHKDTALISAMHHDAGGSNSGAVYLYKKQSEEWVFASKFVAGQGKPEDKFGWNLAFSEQAAIVAAPFRDDQGNESGAAYILDLEEQSNK
ncbi:FG-GAP repeat protein [Planctobacterium marinum]|uniref:FG-GAP repeat protein n=2 Tax=Planctobacterium marinum TaxID=1631968 RepID=UPI001E569C3E|nr:FG-GAP repeat protein [Planctobacterium marinum]MCC2605925.1 FG-GAP repeat protein [Planctobacterium marinum]